MGWPCLSRRSKSWPCPRIRRRPPFRRRISPTSTPPSLIALFVAFAKMSLAGFGGVLVFARRGIVDQHRWMTADEFNETFALCHFLPGPEHRQSVGGVRIALSRHCRRHRGLCRTGRAAGGHGDGPGGALCAFRRDRCVAAHSGRRLLRRGRASDRGGVPDDDAAGQASAIWSGWWCWPRCSSRSALLRLPLPAVLLVAIPLSIAITIAMRRRAAA